MADSRIPRGTAGCRPAFVPPDEPIDPPVSDWIERSLAHYEGSIRGWRFGPRNDAGSWDPDRGETWIQTVVEND